MWYFSRCIIILPCKCICGVQSIQNIPTIFLFNFLQNYYTDKYQYLILPIIIIIFFDNKKKNLQLKKYRFKNIFKKNLEMYVPGIENTQLIVIYLLNMLNGSKLNKK